MKKTLALIMILGLGSLEAVEPGQYWVTGVTYDEATSTITGGYTAYKHTPSSGVNAEDHLMCSAVSASNVIAWWQDEVERNGAVIVPDEAPRGLAVWEDVRLMWKNRALVGGRVMQHYAAPENYMTDKGVEYKGYYSHLIGAHYAFDGSERPSYCMTTNIDSEDVPMADVTEQLVTAIQDGWGFTFGTNNHAMTVYGVEGDEKGLLCRMWYSDNNKPARGDGHVSESGLSGERYLYGSLIGYGGYINHFYGMRSRGIQFDTYTVSMTGKEGEEDLFSHYLNLEVDGANYSLKYDLRNAQAEDSPVEALAEDGSRLRTGDISLKSGHLTLIDSTAEKQEFDKGGSTEGTLSFDAPTKAGAKRTLTVDRSGAIADTIQINTADGNKLEVTESNTATFGSLSGEGNLDKTGKGAAKVTDTVELQGEIRVKEGDFIFGKNVVLTGNTRLTVSDGAHVQGAEGQDITLTITSGVQVNDGVLALTTTVKTGATLKGSGTFAAVTVDGGTLIVGNSPGHQDYEGALTLNSGKLVFCVSGFEEASEGENTGWASGTYSTINMRGNEFVVNENGEIVIALSADAANSLTTANGTLELTLATELKSGAFTEEQLAALAEQTSFELSLEDGAGTKGLPELNAPQFSYKMVDNALVLTTGISGATPAVPEPATGTLSLLALAGLCARRRRK